MLLQVWSAKIEWVCVCLLFALFWQKFWINSEGGIEAAKQAEINSRIWASVPLKAGFDQEIQNILPFNNP